MKFSVSVDSRIGGRQNNEDRFGLACTEESLLLVVADGMGGHVDGEIAAQIAVDVLLEQFRQQAYPLLEQPKHFLSAAIADAHQAIIDHAILRCLSEVPSTTVVAAVVQNGKVYAVYAGDSRFYLVENGKIAVRSRDHSHVQRMIDTGFLNESDAATHPARHRIYNCLGAVGEPEIALLPPCDLSEGATILLCSDGLWSAVPDEELARVFTGRLAGMVLPVLMNVAEKRAGEHGDNLTAVALTLLPEAMDTAGRSDVLDTRVTHGDALSDYIQDMILDRELSQGLSPEQ